MKTKDGVKFNEGLYAIRTEDGRPRRVCGFICDQLGYHKYTLSGYDAWWEKDHGYSITHLPTGARILWVKKATEARRFISEARKLDWNFEDVNDSRAQANLSLCMKIVGQLKIEHTSVQGQDEIVDSEALQRQSQGDLVYPKPKASTVGGGESNI